MQARKLSAPAEVLQVELHLGQQQQELAAYCTSNGIALMVGLALVVAFSGRHMSESTS